MADKGKRGGCVIEREKITIMIEETLHNADGTTTGRLCTERAKRIY